MGEDASMVRAVKVAFLTAKAGARNPSRFRDQIVSSGMSARIGGDAYAARGQRSMRPALFEILKDIHERKPVRSGWSEWNLRGRALNGRPGSVRAAIEQSQPLLGRVRSTRSNRRNNRI